MKRVQTPAFRRRGWFAVCGLHIGLALALLLSACNFQQLGPQNPAQQTEVRATELELHVQQTLVAQRATNQAPELTRQVERATQRSQLPQTVPDTPAPGITPTVAATAIPTVATTPTASASETPTALEGAALLERMQAAQILLFEDMVQRNNTNRYVKDTLDRMGLAYKDDGNAVGWLTEDLNKGPSGGDAWDLVIIALENKISAQSGFFNYVLQALDAGSSVIFETWFLNSTHNGGGSMFMERCGLDYQGNRIKIAPANMGMFPMMSSHPLLNQPNKNIPLSKTNDYWWDTNGDISYDTGDLLALANNSNAQFVIGVQSGNNNDHATLAVCENGRLIVQTFSSHTLTYDTMTLLWENYIYNALKARFETVK